MLTKIRYLDEYIEKTVTRNKSYFYCMFQKINLFDNLYVLED